jgi:hypothetical protein
VVPGRSSGSGLVLCMKKSLFFNGLRASGSSVSKDRYLPNRKGLSISLHTVS